MLHSGLGRAQGPAGALETEAAIEVLFFLPKYAGYKLDQILAPSPEYTWGRGERNDGGL